MLANKLNLIITCSVSVVLFVLIFISLYLTITSRNPVVAILYLITFFFEIAFLFIFFGADYLGVLFLILYAGAISIVFLFVVMFLDFKDLLLERDIYSFTTKKLLIALFGFSFFDLLSNSAEALQTFIYRAPYTNWFEVFNHKTNIEVIGLVFYENFLFQFLVLGILLFLIMVLIISLLINYNILSRKQSLALQVKKKRLIKKF